MNKRIAFSVILFLVFWIALVLLASKSRSSGCSYADVCPSHGVEAQFTGRTQMNQGGCVYGQYRHGGCEHWALCYCP